MSARPSPRFSRAAPWAFRSALLPLPLLALVVLLRHWGLIDLAPMFVVMGLAWGLAALSLVLAAAAFRAIWRDGRRGLRPALAGAALSLVVLAMPAWIVVDMIREPRLADISTDGTDTPLFTVAPDSVTMRPLPGDADKARQADAYPDVVPRHYPLSPERVFQSVDDLVSSRRWRVTDRRAPDTDNEVGWIEAEASTLAFALPVDVVIRVIADDQGTLVDMRSASRVGAHDLGDNAKRVRDFFADLDAALQGVTESGEGADSDADADQDLPPLPEPPPASGR